MIESAENTERNAGRSDPQNRVKGGETRMTVELDVYCPLAHMCRIVVKAIDGYSTKVPRGQERQYTEDFHHLWKTVHGR